MRYIIPTLVLIALAGCGTTRVHELSWSPLAAAQLNTKCVMGCDASIVLQDSTGIEPVRAGRLRVERGELFWGSRNRPFIGSTDTGLVTSVELSRQRHGRGALAGLGLGALGGAVFGATVGSATWEPCEETGFLACMMHPDSRGEAAGVGAAVGGILGGLAGLLVGAIVGTKDVTVYRYRPDTPDQMRIVVGLTPATLPRGNNLER